MNVRNTILLAVLVIGAAVASYSSTVSSYLHEGRVVTLSWGTTSATPGIAVVKGIQKSQGAVVGVALDGTGTAGENVRVITEGVFDLPVSASSTVGNICPGDYIYTTLASGVCTTSLSNINTGILYGVALEPSIASTTDGVLETIKVMIRQPGHL